MTSVCSVKVNDSKLPNNEQNVSPSSSPRTSPRPSPQTQNKQEHNSSSNTNSKLDSNSRDSFKHEGSPSSQESSISRVSSSPDPSPQSDQRTTDSSLNVKKDNSRIKKKSSWFNSLYPTYKSRSADFKNTFIDIPSDERLIVDYSCALQRDILVQGRLYITQNFLCFYANIFGWETNLTLKWKEVTAITKEKTALVIPNAVLISTKTEKYFFTSLVHRDKTYVMLFRLWQNALIEQPLTQQALWTWVHYCYGSELGLTSDDEDYISPFGQDEEKLSSRLSLDSLSETKTTSSLDCVMDPVSDNEKISMNDSKASSAQSEIHHHSDSESDKPITMKEIVECTATHEGKKLLDDEYPIHIDQLFTLLFTSSKFYLDFHASRKTTDLTQTPWTHNPLDNSKSRVVNLTMSLQTMGPKTCQVTERHTMLPCSKSGSLYAVDVETVNAGVPYADSFYVTVHYCLKKVSDTKSSLNVTGQLEFKKRVWGLVQGMIERNVWSGLEDFFSKLKEALHAESQVKGPKKVKKYDKKGRMHSLPRRSLEEPGPLQRKKFLLSPTSSIFSTDVCTIVVFIVLLILLILNVLLYYKLWSLEESSPNVKLMDLRTLKHSPKSHDEWIELLQHQETQRSVEAQKWHTTLSRVVHLLREAEDALENLRRSIQPDYLSKIMETMEDGVANLVKKHEGEL
ncbi:hypothetical protein ABEB36_001809 [Hypothenemus hampei]|uniref:VASt domain-containing protein n=1 Tax=Hypothenemus hampei TaxID=57062 RepID=A0ABD1FIF4_HYPHA